MKRFYILLFFVFINNATIFGQEVHEIIQDFLNQHHQEQGLTKEDVNHWVITDHHTSQQSKATYVYIRQQYQGIGIANGVANFAIKDGKVFSMGNRLVDHLSQKVNYTTPSITPNQAIQTACEKLGIETPKDLKVLEALSSQHFIYNNGGISKEKIPVQLMYHAVSDAEVRLVWDLSIYTLDAEHWWSVRIDAQNGTILDQNDWVIHCNFDHSPFEKCNHQLHFPDNYSAPETILQPDQYMVFPLPLESPNHGPRSLVTNPADVLASPYGWHDNNGVAGAEYTITRGNNVFAYDDVADTDAPGFSPDGTAALEFNFPYNGSNAPSAYQSAAITNLFYMNNMMHDIWYHYGFDEASGNFQENNYGRGGTADDYVLAEAQDGGGTNNANFATPEDGFNPRMQMYLWTTAGAGGNYLDVNSPAGIAGSYAAADAAFGPGLPSTPITANFVLVTDNTAPVNDGCETITNAAQIAGKIAVIDRGTCAFTAKVEAAQAAGAVAVIIVNNVAATPTQMGGTSAIITIPSIIISQADGNAIKAQMASGTVNGTISDGGAGSSTKDGDLDNGIIAHEYGHGISTRLTGGPANSNCLNNPEQMGEGWSDWFGLMLTIEPGDQGSDIRGIGTYATGEPITGGGIRPAPYSTSFAVNNYTYDASNNAGQISEPHGVGFIYATALWDLTWALIAQYGGTPSTDLYNGTAGNNIAMQLVIESLKLQPCDPGMLDGRDAILQADQLLYGGIHQCLIWTVFANRGFGYSADQGSVNSRSDQTEAFDLPPSCQTATVAPNAAFTPSALTSCVTSISFEDNSTNIAQSWLWNFGDGSTSTLQNPTHIFTTSGTFTVKLVVTNTIGSDSTTQQVTITLPPSPIVADVQVCAGDTAYIPASATGIVQWRNIANNVIYNGDTLVVPNVGSTATYYAENMVGAPSQQVGPVNGNFAGGGYHGNTFHGALNFTANQSLEIVSVWVDADGAGPRTITLASGSNTNGNAPGAANIVQQATVNLVNGPQRVNLNFLVPASGAYNLGCNNADMYRNNAGASFPYTLPTYLSITSSSSTTNPSTFYYYFYDWEVRTPQCISAKDTVTVTPVVSNFTYVDNGGTVSFTDASVDATSWFWQFGDGNTSTQQNPTHTYGTPGAYTVTLTINNGACASTQTFSVVLGVNNIGTATPKLALMPNPTSGLASIILDKALAEDLTISITDMSGKTVQNLVLRAGNTALDMNLQELPAAVYMVRIQGDKFSETRKLVVE